jgi:hypothetical protein
MDIPWCLYYRGFVHVGGARPRQTSSRTLQSHNAIEEGSHFPTTPNINSVKKHSSISQAFDSGIWWKQPTEFITVKYGRNTTSRASSKKGLISITHSLGHQVIHSSLPNALTSEIKACSLKHKKENTDNELLWFRNKKKGNIGLLD